jgi:hypothetical protein
MTNAWSSVYTGLFDPDAKGRSDVIDHGPTSYKSRTASMKKAASSENRAIRDDMAYSGTLERGQLRPVHMSQSAGSGSSHDHNPHDCPL